MALMRESLALIVIGLADLLYTLVLMEGKGATEGNPLMAYYLQFGIGAFVLVKLGLLFLPVFVAEWSRRHRPAFVRTMMRSAIVMYLGTYLLLFVLVNLAPLTKAEPVTPRAQPVRVAERAR